MIQSMLLNPDGNLLRLDGDGISQWHQQPGSILWLDITKEDPQQEERLLKQLQLHPLAIQDALRDRHPPKLEEFDHFTFLLYRGLKKFDERLDVEHIQVSFFVGANFLVTYHNGPALSISHWWDLQREAELKQHLTKPAILLTRILKTSMNRYLDGLLELEDELSQIEDSMLERPTDTIMHDLVTYRSRLRKLNRVFSYHERLIRRVLKESTGELNMEDVALYHAMQDVYDKSERLHSLGILFYDQCGDLVEGYLSLTSHQLNKTMQALTVITAIFVPLGLLAGIYGMNFDHMPELHSQNGYFILLGVMATVAIVLLLLFKRRGWL